jgi:hypothetical protein
MNSQTDSRNVELSQRNLAEAPDGDGAALPELLRCPPVVIRAVGTYATGAVRYFHTALEAQYGKRPEHIAILAVDSTDQTRLDGVGTLPPDSFVNVAEVPQIQDCLRRAREDPRVAAYMPEPVTRLAAGDGAGGFPAAARFFYELKEPELDAIIRQVLRPFLPADRPVTANRANRHPLLRHWNMTVSADGPIRVVYVASTTGGTVGTLIYDVILFNHVMRQLGIEAKITLLLTLPATAPLDDVEAQRRRQLLFGRLQELSDLDAGKALCWPLAGKVLSERDRLFDTIFIQREPASEHLQKHQRFVGELLLQLVSPLGMTLFSKAVDMVHVHTQTGPCGQKKLLDLMGMATIDAAAFDDVRAYARAALGRKALAPRSIANGAALMAEVLRRNQITAAAIASPPLALIPWEIPQDLDGDPTGFLNYAENEARRQVEAKVKQLALDFSRGCTQVQRQAITLLRDGCLQAGPQGAFAMGQVLLQSLKALETADTDLPAARAATKSEANTDDVRKRLAARLESQRQRAVSEYRILAIESVRRLSAAVERSLVILERAAEAFKELEIRYDQQHEAFLMQPAPEHALLDRPALDGLIARAAPACAQAARKWTAGIFEPEFDPAQLEALVRKTIDEHAEPFARLADVNEALRAAGEYGRVVLENAAAAAEPAVRTDAQSDWRRGCVRHAYLAASEAHPLADIVRRQSRHVFSAVTGTTARRMTLITADYGIEPAALAATREALQAQMAATSEIPPFTDRAYEPMTDVMVPAPTEWFAYLALPIFLHHRKGPITYDMLRGYLYDGQPLGKDRVAASAALLARTGRPPFLPGFEELCVRVEAALHQACGGDGALVVAELGRIEATLDRHIAGAGPAEKQVLMLERAAARALQATVDAMLRQHRAYLAAGYGHDQPADPDRSVRRPARIPSQEPSDDGATNHRRV